MGPTHDFCGRAGYDGEGDAGPGDCPECGEEGQCGLRMYQQVMWNMWSYGEERFMPKRWLSRFVVLYLCAV